MKPSRLYLLSTSAQIASISSTVGSFKAIFTLATAGLGRYTSAASGVFMIGVVGGAILPLVQGFAADALGSWRWSWLLVLLGEIIMLLYARIGSRQALTHSS